MAEIVWIETPLVDQTDEPVDTPGSTLDIDSNVDASAYASMWLTADTTGGTTPSLTVTLWLWNGTRYVTTGDVFPLRPGADNLARHDGGGVFAYQVAVSGSPTAWALNIGGQR